MPLSPGDRLGPHQIVATLGVGGMGEVYRAKDTRLDRDVALKVLPQELFENPERVARFEREAKLLGALNHPNIAAVHSFEEITGRHVLVQELLEGETLRIALAGAKVATKKALAWALQIAKGLAAAHEKGIVHRDLKPENLFVTKDGRVKILDFGLAKLTQAGDDMPGTTLPTATHATEPGVVMGTLGYMSPEQVRGKPADARSDIFSFGAVLYEMLSGQRAFHRETAAETIAAILKEDPPDLTVTNQNVPPELERIVAHCLEKSPEQRFHSAHDLAFDLESIATGSGAQAVAATRSWRLRFRASGVLLLATGLAIGLAAGALGARKLFPSRVLAPPEYQLLTYSGSDGQPSATQDGRTIVFTSSRDGRSRIWVKQLAGGAEAVLTEGTDTLPRLSPDGSAVLFVRALEGESAIFRAPLVGGEARKVVGRAFEADWSPDGKEIAFLRRNAEKVESSLYRAGVDGANEKLVATIPGRILNRVRWSPDGRNLATLESQGTGTASQTVVIVPVDGTAPRRLDTAEIGSVLGCDWNGNSRELVLLTGTPELATRSRMARVFLKDAVTGASRVLLSGIDIGGAVEVFGSGSLLLVNATRRSNLREVSLTGEGPGRWLTRGGSIDRQPTYAPDGEWVAFASNRSGNEDIWEASTKSGAVRRLTDDPAADFDPAYTKDGKHLLFSSKRSGHFEIWISDRDGSGARRVSDDGVDAENPSATPDGEWIVYFSGNPDKRGIWKMRLDGTQATRLVPGLAILPEISPDGRVVSYVEVKDRVVRIRAVRLEDGAVVPFESIVTGPGGNQGRHRWMPDGHALVRLVKADQSSGLALQDFGPGRGSQSPRDVAGFTTDSAVESFGISPDGTRAMVSELQGSTGLLLAEGVDGVIARPPAAIPR